MKVQLNLISEAGAGSDNIEALMEEIADKLIGTPREKVILDWMREASSKSVQILRQYNNSPFSRPFIKFIATKLQVSERQARSIHKAWYR